MLFHIVCSRCFRPGPRGLSIDVVDAVAHAAGWQCNPKDGVHLCPWCRAEDMSVSALIAMLVTAV